MIQAEGLSKCFGEAWALRDVSFRVAPGTFLGVLGRNGAGKTTLVRLLTGQARPTAGTVRVLGRDAAARPLDLRRRVGVMPEPSALLDDLTGEQYLHAAGRLHGLPPDILARRITDLGDLLEVDFRRSARIQDFSFGMRKKTALAASLLHGPELLFLDEPFEGLDPVASGALLGILASLRDHGTTVVLTSHLLGMAERLCTRYLLLDKGGIKAEGAPGDLLRGGEDLEAFFLREVGAPRKEAPAWM
jgi:ABC-2 type transport system ATP-binding protein